MKQLYNAKIRSDGRSEVIPMEVPMLLKMNYQYDPHAGEGVHVFTRDGITVSGRTEAELILKMQKKLNK